MVTSVTGSPPPMRGKDTVGKYQGIGSRITPAYAGKRKENAFFVSHNEDHPRLCGEKRCGWDGISGITGSPPPMRGKVLSQSPEAFNGTGSPPPMRGKD